MTQPKQQWVNKEKSESYSVLCKTDKMIRDLVVIIGTVSQEYELHQLKQKIKRREKNSGKLWHLRKHKMMGNKGSELSSVPNQICLCSDIDGEI